jgi:probable HAF family extracellular repeat protein
MSVILKHSRVIGLALALLAGATAAARSGYHGLGSRRGSPPRYRMTDLGGVLVTGLNDRAQVVGSLLGGDPRSGPVFLWQNGSRQDITVAAAHGPNLSMVNGAGQITVSIESRDHEDHAGIWRAGVQTDLGILPPKGSFSIAYGINDAGQVVGWANERMSGRLTRAFLWDTTHGMRDIGTLGGDGAIASAVNREGQVVGESDIPSSQKKRTSMGNGTHAGHAFLWTSGHMRDLGTLPGDASSQANAVNDVGQVVGQSGRSGDTQLSHPFLWGASSGMTRLPTLSGYSSSVVLSINDAGQAVGYSVLAGRESRAVLWRNGRVYPLDTLVPSGFIGALNVAVAINNQGQVAVRGRGGWDPHSFLLTPR